MATKTSNVTARVEPEVKEQAETILSDLGIPVSTAINIFYRQIGPLERTAVSSLRSCSAAQIPK